MMIRRLALAASLAALPLLATPARADDRDCRGPVSAEERRGVIEYSPVWGKYEEAVDRESAHEILAKRAEAAAKEQADSSSGWGSIFGGPAPSGGKRRPASFGEQVAKEMQRSFARSAGTMIKNIIVKSIFGGRR